MVTDRQVRKLMEELERTGSLSKASMKAGMDRKTARKWRDDGGLPSESERHRSYRTRSDPFEGDWSVVSLMLADAPELEAKTLFEYLVTESPGHYVPGQLRTLQRRVKRWRAIHGPPREVFFPQRHVMGEAFQTDFTHCDELCVTLQGEAFPHLLCHVVLPASNWQWATVCRSESMAALRDGVQNAVFKLGCVARYHQTDNSTAATHDLRTGKRGFNKDYADFMVHLGMTPRTTGVGKKEQNGDVEAANGALKRRIKQHLLVRGSRDFSSVAAYQSWLHGVLGAANVLRQEAIDRELGAMRPVRVKRLLSYTVQDVKVSAWSTIRVKNNSYSVPSRLIGERVRIRLFEDRLEVWFADQRELTVDRLVGRSGHRIDYRHIIWSLVRKPGAFQRYRYREDLFPTVSFRRAYDALATALVPRSADIAYLRILHLAASSGQADVETAVAMLLEESVVPTFERVRELAAPVATPTQIPQDIPPYQPELTAYDGLIGGVA